MTKTTYLSLFAGLLLAITILVTGITVATAEPIGSDDEFLQLQKFEYIIKDNPEQLEQFKEFFYDEHPSYFDNHNWEFAE